MDKQKKRRKGPYHDCEICGKEFHYLGYASHRSACYRKLVERKKKDKGGDKMRTGVMEVLQCQACEGEVAFILVGENPEKVSIRIMKCASCGQRQGDYDNVQAACEAGAEFKEDLTVK